MSDIEKFEFADDFDPLADTSLTDEEAIEEERFDYQAPIPDADKSIVPPPRELPAEERIENLLSGIPGQSFRILAVVSAFTDEREETDALLEVEEAYPQGRSVYPASRLLQLLEQAGAIECTNEEEREAALAEAEAAEAAAAGTGAEAAEAAAAGTEAEAGEAAVNIETADDEAIPAPVYLTVPEVPAKRYRATEAGLAAVTRHIGSDVVATLLNEEPRYLPVYLGLIERMNVEGGVNVKELDTFVNAQEVAQNPRRMSSYFLDRLEKAGAVHYDHAWKATKFGLEALEKFGTEGASTAIPSASEEASTAIPATQEEKE